MTSSTILWAADLITEEGIRQGQHMPGWTSEEADQLLQDFLKTPDPEEQKAIVEKLDQLFVSNILMSPLSPWPTWYEYSTLRFTGWPTEEDYYAQGSPWQNDAARIVAVFHPLRRRHHLRSIVKTSAKLGLEVLQRDSSPFIEKLLA